MSSSAKPASRSARGVARLLLAAERDQSVPDRLERAHRLGQIGLGHSLDGHRRPPAGRGCDFPDTTR